MRREGRLGGKPSNHSKMTGKCRVVGCEQCHESLPLKKSQGKGKGRVKRLVSDIPSTHLISDWRVSKPSLKMARKWDPDTDDDEEVEPNDGGYGGGTKPEGWALSISLLLDTALVHIQESVDAVCRKAEEEEACDPSQAAVHFGNVDDDSADSWSGIELSDADDLGYWEDDWSVVGDEVAV